MQTPSLQLFSPWRILLNAAKLPFGLLLVLSLTINGFRHAGVKAAEAPERLPITRANRVIEPSTPQAGSDLPADGIYLYGQSEQPEQLGQAYMVFESRQGRVVGAFYMPRSSFDCFYGGAQAQRLALTVVDSYSQEPFSYTIARTDSSLVASTERATAGKLMLQDFHAIETISDNDQRMLEVCRANYQNQVWN
ncbi:MAG: hypothetical protein F6K19_27555 [Cyanothece sp. SIO1E1]|nr:hypothetical protein [Cyanothece sp. SIO1E1]